ncbi:MAG: hypothetical protein INH41_12455 [Myxococcaceae bacterium]|nr:hypothetical protein [Myxococcaceae bacterium]
MNGILRGGLGLCLAVSACGPAEVRVDETKGIPPVRGTTEVALQTFTCGMPITSGEVRVETKVVSGGCELSFDRDVPVLRAEDYTNIPDLRLATALVQRIELVVKTLRFSDGATMQPLDLNTRITSAQLSVNGQVVAEKASLTQLPRTVTLEGAALDAMKSRIDARQPASVRTRVVAVVPTTPAPPQRLVVDYDTQPAIVWGAKTPTLF